MRRSRTDAILFREVPARARRSRFSPLRHYLHLPVLMEPAAEISLGWRACATANRWLIAGPAAMARKMTRPAATADADGPLDAGERGPAPIAPGDLPMDSTAPPRALHGVEFIVLMALIQALQALGIDAMLPALDRLSGELGVFDGNRRQWVVAVFLIFCGLGALVPGAVADRFGRRSTLLVCLGIFITMNLACALAPSFPALLVFRAGAGLGSAGLSVLPIAIIRDRYEGDRMARMQSTVAMVFMVVPMIAPSLGQAVLLVAGWRWIFGMIAALAALVAVWVALRFAETLRPEYRQPIELRAVIANIGMVSGSRAASGYVLGTALILGALLGYINSCQQLLGEHFGAGTRFPLIFGGMALTMGTANFANSRIVERFGARRVSHSALLCYIATSGIQLGLAFSGHETLWQFVPVMTINLCLMGFITANFASIALQPFARVAGSAASAQTFVRMLGASVLGALVGNAYDGTARPLAIALVIAGFGTLALVLFSERGRLFRRLNRPSKV